METNYKDKNGKIISVGDEVKFKFYGQWFTETVTKYKDDYLPFAELRIECGIGGVDPSKCEIVATKSS